MYPTALDSFVNPTVSSDMIALSHSAQHAALNDAVEALEAKLGIGASVAANNKLLRGTGAGASAWDKDAPSGTIVGTTDSQTLTNKTLTSPTINTAIINNPTLNVNTISEYTGAAGVTIDGLLIKDSKLATNNSVVTANITDDAVTAAKIDWAGTGANGGIWWEELGRSTLGSAGDTLNITSFAARKYLMIILNLIPSGAIQAYLRFNNDSSSNYARRDSADGGADTTSTSATSIALGNSASNIFATYTILNVATREKIVNYRMDFLTASGAGTAPSRQEGTAKWTNTADQITRIDFVNGAAGDYAVGSQVIVLGHD